MALVLPLRLAATLTREQAEWIERNYARMDPDTQARFHRMLGAEEPPRIPIPDDASNVLRHEERK